MDTESILAAKLHALELRKAKTPIEAIRALASMQKRPQPILSTITRGAQVTCIGQVTRAPADAPYDPVAQAQRWQRAGVDGIALFTDGDVYANGLHDLALVARAVSLPLIAQDYICDEYQVVEARAAGASGVVLYAQHLDAGTLRRLVSAVQRNRMTAIVQIGAVQDLEPVIAISPPVIACSFDASDTSDAESWRALSALIPPHMRVLSSRPVETWSQRQALSALYVDPVHLDGVHLDGVHLDGVHVDAITFGARWLDTPDAGVWLQQRQAALDV